MSKDTTALASGAWAQEAEPWGAQSSRCLVLKGKAAWCWGGSHPAVGLLEPTVGRVPALQVLDSLQVCWTADQLSPHPSRGLRQRAGSWRSPDS